MIDGLEVRGVRLNDVYRDAAGDLWEVVSLCTEPQAGFRRVRDLEQVKHVIGCRNMLGQFPDGPMRAPAAAQERTRPNAEQMTAEYHVRRLLAVVAPLELRSLMPDARDALVAAHDWLKREAT